MLFAMLYSGASLGWRLSLGALPKRPAAVRMDARFAPGMLPNVIPNYCSIGQEDPDEREAILSLLPLSSTLHPTGLHGRSMSKKAKGGGNGGGGGGGGGGEIDFSITPVSPSRLKPSTSSHSSILRDTCQSFPLPTTTCPFAQFAGARRIRNANEQHNVTLFAAACLHSTLHVHSSGNHRAHSSFLSRERAPTAFILPKALGHDHPSESLGTYSSFGRPSLWHISVFLKTLDHIYTISKTLAQHLILQQHPKP
jgi:hypothetical protein